VVHTSELHHAHSDVVLFRVFCAVRTRLWSHLWFHCMLFFGYRAWVTVNMTQALFCG